ncbi:glycoside hydrolase family 2 protein [Streptomyces sp. NPDC091268]|uniref:glycoside hydrolase family 2 protein n=1 Tax=Streptomyces sp. NPDC091268 TaxID=3365979 RepID=UPI0038097FF7
MKDVTQLNEGWSLRHEGALLPARVPGCVHTDLLAAGVIDDPYIGRNETEVAWIGRQEWTYTRQLRHDSGHERTDLVFEGLDTAADIVLAGESLGTTRNMHRVHRFDVSGRTGPLEVRFASAYEEADRVRALTGERPGVYPEPYQYVRKMACSFGWDWGPTVVSAGMWRPVRLEHWSTARLADVRPLVTVDGATGSVELRVRVERTAGGAGRPLTLGATVAGVAARTVVEGDEAVLRLDVAEPERWWPRGHGAQPLYGLTVTLLDEDGQPLDVWERRIGFRTVTVDRSADEHGTSFTFVVNGVRIFARGVNWIPDDVLPSRVTPDRYRTRLTQAAEAHVDLVRVWGGGIYEDDAFYDVCDELGLMVWQDFLFACAAYPEEQPLRGEIEAEARDNVVRLMPHPSLVLWNGNNENLWGFRDWDWEEPLAGDSWGEGYYLGLLPRVVAELDPTRPYAAGSPWSGSWDHHPNDPRHGTHHSWEVWNRRDYADYRADVPRFCAEFGWQAPAALATLRRALPGEELAPDSPGMLHHQKAEDGNGKLNRGIARHFDLPDGDFDRWHYLAQVVQARAVAAGIEHWRANWPVCAGTVVWQLNDCWPVSSWAAIDGDGRCKPLYHELRRVYADRVLTLLPTDEGPVLVLDNQSGSPWRTTVTLRRLDAAGTVLREARLALETGVRTVLRRAVAAELLPEEGSSKEFLVADTDAEGGALRAVHFPVVDKEFGYVPAQYDVRTEAGAADGAVEVVVTARTVVRDLLLQADRLAPGAAADRGLITLLPGEEARITVTGWPGAEAGAGGGGVSGADLDAVRGALFSV